VASDLPAIKEVLTHGSNAWLCAPDSGEALGQAVKTIIEDPGLANNLGASARAQVERYSWDSRIRSIMEFARNRQAKLNHT